MQWDQMAKLLFVQFVAIYNNEKLANIMKKLAK